MLEQLLEILSTLSDDQIKGIYTQISSKGHEGLRILDLVFEEAQKDYSFLVSDLITKFNLLVSDEKVELAYNETRQLLAESKFKSFQSLIDAGFTREEAMQFMLKPSAFSLPQIPKLSKQEEE